MSPAFFGADTQELLQLARELERTQEALGNVCRELGAKINGRLRWEGPDAFVFRHAWQSSYSPSIAKTAAMLGDTAALIRKQAAEQDAASG